MDLPHNLLSEVVEVLLGVHELLEIDHRVEVSDDEQFVLAAGHVDIHLVHGDVLGEASVSVLLHLGVVLLHLVGSDVERKWGSLLRMIQEVPCCRTISVLFFTESLNFCSLEHVMQLVVVGVFLAFVFAHLEHSTERAVSIEDLAAADQGQSLRECFKDLEPAIEGLFIGLLAQESLFVESFDLVGDDSIQEYAENASDYEFVHLVTHHILASLPHVVSEQRSVHHGRKEPALVEYNQNEVGAGDANNHRVVY